MVSKQDCGRAISIIFEAIKKEKIIPVIKIVKAGFHIDTPMEAGMTVLMNVAGNGNTDMIN